MNKTARRDRTIAGAIAIGTSLVILTMKPLSLIGCFGAVMFALGAYPTVANLLSRVRGDVPSVAIRRGEDGIEECGPIGAIVGPASFTAIVALIWLAA